MYHCSDCNLLFKHEKCLQAHYKTKKHLNGNKESKYKCPCGNSYSYRQGLYSHKQKCTYIPNISQDRQTSTSLSSEVTTNTVDSQVVLQQQKKDIKEAFEEERQNMKNEIEERQNMKNEIEAMKKELLKTNKRLQKLETKTTTTSPLVPTIRRKINKDLRQSIVDKQENACGSCKLALTSYFQIDHTVGLQFGGTDEESNLMALCCECHAMKSIAENKCRKQIREAIQTILIENLEK